MNYLRGAISTISAPYQYYRDLPPINPATLTGAIDVIVIQRPSESGGTELACSPFHVRFGKLQVLRPGEKKVDVTVNGHKIPFSMKIGEAGDAFFVFQTEDDIPEDLVTSPILQATKPDGSPASPDLQAEGSSEANGRPVFEQADRNNEPDFLDLNALPSPAETDQGAPVSDAGPSTSTAASVQENGKLSPDVTLEKYSQVLPSPPPSPSRPGMTEEELQNERADMALERLKGAIRVPHVKTSEDLAYDVEGYHPSAHDREASDTTVRSAESSSQHAFPSSSAPHHKEPSLAHSDRPVPFPSLRATSEPPPDALEDEYDGNRTPSQLRSPQLRTTVIPVQEYSWEWGNFPQPSPVQPTSGGPITGDESVKVGRSKTVQGSPSKRKTRPKTMMMSLGSFDSAEQNILSDDRFGDLLLHSKNSIRRRTTGDKPVYVAEDSAEGGGEFGSGGKLHPSRSDPTKFQVIITGQRVEFELSVIPEDVTTPTGNNELKDFFDVLHTDEVDAAIKFDIGKVDFEQFMKDDSIINHPRLVIRWIGDRYIVRHDGSPLMNAIKIWRDTRLRKIQEGGSISRPTSPSLSSDEDEARSSTDEVDQITSRTSDLHIHRSNSEPPEQSAPAAETSSSWSLWWRGRRKADTTQSTKLDTTVAQRAELEPFSGDLATRRSSSKAHPAFDSAPALPSTPVGAATPESQPTATPKPLSSQSQKRFAKTLRLTSDQLKSLNLKPGPNTMTFSLASTGVVACTAKIFVWDSTDLIVVSDIDGTITKSDGLGHVFAMIGRDWTHSGVAKLYTDICKNGYKILYLTSRAIGQADATRGYLKGIKQNDYELPEGPVIMSPDRLMASLHREVIMRKPEVFKMACLRDIQRLFGEASRNPFYAGFGNRITDALSYRSVNVPSARIFTIDSTGEVKLELLELAGYKSSYIHMTDLVDQMFPPIHRKWTPEYTDFNYWKAPMQEFDLPDLFPPSPTLSARSDASTFSRIRNLSLMGNRQANVPKQVASRETSPPPDGIALQQMNSFERLGSSLGFRSGASSPTGSRSRSPDSRSSTYAVSDGEEEEDEWRSRRRERTQSVTSMPGSLDGFSVEEVDEDDQEETDTLDDMEDDHPEDHFDDDILAEGEMMQKVPFL